ncbi:hypothetical protein RB200_05410 [Streptomyces sp. PmtG]
MRTTVSVFAVSSRRANLNGPAETLASPRKPLLKPSAVRRMTDAGYSGVNSDRHSPNGLAKSTVTSRSPPEPRDTFVISS